VNALSVEIVRVVDACHPGRVAGEFSDADGRRHTRSSTSSPQRSCTASEIEIGLDECVRTSTERPWHLESIEGLSEFVVFATQLVVDFGVTGKTAHIKSRSLALIDLSFIEFV
jgi:hypothetical protein